MGAIARHTQSVRHLGRGDGSGCVLWCDFALPLDGHRPPALVQFLPKLVLPKLPCNHLPRALDVRHSCTSTQKAATWCRASGSPMQQIAKSLVFQHVEGRQRRRDGPRCPATSPGVRKRANSIVLRKEQTEVLKRRHSRSERQKLPSGLDREGENSRTRTDGAYRDPILLAGPCSKNTGAGRFRYRRNGECKIRRHRCYEVNVDRHAGLGIGHLHPRMLHGTLCLLHGMGRYPLRALNSFDVNLDAPSVRHRAPLLGSRAEVLGANDCQVIELLSTIVGQDMHLEHLLRRLLGTLCRLALLPGHVLLRVGRRFFYLRQFRQVQLGHHLRLFGSAATDVRLKLGHQSLGNRAADASDVSLRFRARTRQLRQTSRTERLGKDREGRHQCQSRHQVSALHTASLLLVRRDILTLVSVFFLKNYVRYCMLTMLSYSFRAKLTSGANHWPAEA